MKNATELLMRVCVCVSITCQSFSSFGQDAISKLDIDGGSDCEVPATAVIDINHLNSSVLYLWEDLLKT